MYKQVSVQKAQDLIINRADMVVADVRSDESFETEAIPGAVHMNMPLLQEFAERDDKNVPILVYCYHGVSSQSVAQHLISLGFQEVYSMIGGFEEWKQMCASDNASDTDNNTARNAAGDTASDPTGGGDS